MSKPDKRIDNVSWREWLAERPKLVRKMAKKYPPGTKFNIHGQHMHVMSYEEDGGISVTAIDPFEDYENAVKERKPVCSCCVGKLDELVIL